MTASIAPRVLGTARPCVVNFAGNLFVNVLVDFWNCRYMNLWCVALLHLDWSLSVNLGRNFRLSSHLISSGTRDLIAASSKTVDSA